MELQSRASHYFCLFRPHLCLYPGSNSISALLSTRSKTIVESPCPDAIWQLPCWPVPDPLSQPSCLKTSQCPSPRVSHGQLVSCLEWFLCPAESHPNFETQLCPISSVKSPWTPSSFFLWYHSFIPNRPWNTHHVDIEILISSPCYLFGIYHFSVELIESLHEMCLPCYPLLCP